MSTVILPYSLWRWPAHDSAWLAQARQSLHAPHWQAWLQDARVLPIDWLVPASDWHPDGVRLNAPHEWAQAYARGWLTPAQLQDGLLPLAAEQAALRQLNAPPDHGWAIISWCHWQVSQGSVKVLPPDTLAINDALDAQLFAVMQPFFEQAGVFVHRHHNGHWLAHAPEFKQLPTASLERMLHRNVDAGLLMGHNAQARAPKLKRLQNEVQMLLYTHEINHEREWTINSFWLHGTGEMLTGYGSMDDVWVWDDLRDSALAQDVSRWTQTWATLDQRLAQWPHHIERCILCGEDELHLYESFTPTRWQQWARALNWRAKPVSLPNLVLSIQPSL
jgi:hypothetical protein